MSHFTERDREMQELVKFRTDWNEGKYRNASPQDLLEKLEWFEAGSVKYPYHKEQDQEISEEIKGLFDSLLQRVLKASQAKNPIAYFKPSWTQAQILNTWSPQYEPELAPQGYRTCFDVSAIRAGKTCATVINQIMWLIPNDPDWLMFQPYVDFKGRTVQVFRRPVWDYWDRTGKMVYDPTEPPKSTCENWHGCPDEMHWKEKTNREYLKWMPMEHIARRGNENQWNVSERWFETKWGSRVNGKLYMSDMQAWSGKELFLITFDEGPPKDKLEEARLRTTYLNWAYTPREAANTGDRTKVAYEAWKGDYELPGPVRRFQFTWDDVPDHVMKTKSKEMREKILSAEGKNDANRVAREGGFFFSSPVVFDAFKREKHVLPVDGEKIRRAIKNELHPNELTQWPWLKRLGGANIVRGFDEGTAHPSACIWRAILRTGESVYFKEWCEPAHSITERAKAIIEASGNERLLVTPEGPRRTNEQLEIQRMYANELLVDRHREVATGQKLPRYREKFKGMRIRKTVADSKIFRRDPNDPLTDWTQNYSRAGLKMDKATSQGPAARCDYCNGLFLPDYTREHLNPAQDDPDKPHGFQAYVTKDCETLIERLENYLHGQIVSGPRAGDFTGKPEVRNDDLIDAFAYVACLQMRWVDMSTVIRSGDR